jgi:hypothetical protein
VEPISYLSKEVAMAALEPEEQADEVAQVIKKIFPQGKIQ